MKTLLLAASIVITFSFNCFSQNLIQKVYSGIDIDVITDVLQIPSGYMMVGSTWSSGAGSMDMVVMKTDNNGHIIWAYTYGQLLNQSGGKIIRNHQNNGYLISGEQLVNSLSTYRILLFMIDDNGNIKWNKSYKAIQGTFNHSNAPVLSNLIVCAGKNNLVKTSDGGYIFTASTFDSILTNNNSGVVTKIDSLGNIIWNTNVRSNGGANLYFNSIITLPSGNIIIVGAISSWDAILVKLNKSGNLILSKTFNAGSDYGTSVLLNNKNELVMVGYTDAYSGNQDVFLYKLDTSGNPIKYKQFLGSSGERIFDIKQTNDNGYVLAGVTGSFGIGTPNFANAFLLKTDSSFNYSWIKNLGGQYDDNALCVTQNSDNSYIMAGSSNSFGVSNYDMFFVKTDLLGNHTCLEYPGIVQTLDTSMVVTSVTYPTTNMCSASNFDLIRKAFTVFETGVCDSTNNGGGSSNYVNNINSNESIIKVYPNPCSDFLYFNLKENGFVKVFNLSGIEILNGKITSNHNSINITQLNSGMYLLEINIGDKIYHQKFIKE